MIAPRLLTREEVHAHLDAFGCVCVQDFDTGDNYYRASYWRAPWGFHFLVPEIGPDRLCSEQRLYEIMAELAHQKTIGKA